eukprot:IDg22201t1
MNALTAIERNFGRKPARIRTKNANEYMTKATLDSLASQAIAIDPTTAYTPQENAVAERVNRTIMQRVRATLNAASLPFEKYWVFCLLDTVTKMNACYQRT